MQLEKTAATSFKAFVATGYSILLNSLKKAEQNQPLLDSVQIIIFIKAS